MRNEFGEVTGPQRIDEALSELFTRRGWGRVGAQSRIERAWKEAAGKFANLTTVGGLSRGTLEILVADGMTLQELAGFHKLRLLGELNEALGNGKVRKLRFKLNGS